MTTTAQDITVYEGEDKNITISVTDTAGGSAVNMTAATSITWRVTTKKNVDTATIEKTLAAGGITLANDAGTNDQIVIALASADTQGLEGDKYYHECRMVDSAGKNHVVAIGYFDVKYSVTG